MIERNTPGVDALPQSPTRRLVLAAATLTLGGVVVGHAASPAAQGGETQFMALSSLLIAHRLDPAVGARLADALHAYAGSLKTDIDALIALAESRNARIVEDFLPAATPEQQVSARRIISAWYLGTVDDVAGTNVISYELALMFQPVRDVMTIPTYAISRPNGWSADAPPLAAMPKF